MGRGRYRAALVAAAQRQSRIGLNMDAVARFLWRADVRKILPLRDIYAARLVSLGAQENPGATLPRPTENMGVPQFNARALFNFVDRATAAEVPTLQAILATVRFRVG